LVSGTYASLGKALAAYLRGIRPLPVALDRYAAGDPDALTPSEKNGLLYFFEVGCIQCHYGPLLLDGTSHSNYFPTGHQDLSRDWGRLVGLSQLVASEFRGDGLFSDAPQAASWLSELPAQSSDVGQFRTPSLRGVADTAPYTHGGTAKNLDELMALYATAGVPDGDPQATGMRDLALVRFDPNDPRNDLLIQFLRTLKATVSQP
jgi:cytochrome c peroxidase